MIEQRSELFSFSIPRIQLIGEFGTPNMPCTIDVDPAALGQFMRSHLGLTDDQIRRTVIKFVGAEERPQQRPFGQYEQKQQDGSVFHYPTIYAERIFSTCISHLDGTPPDDISDIFF
ncbi:MAG: hypothetical protein Q8R11_03985 [bacterium]|nr:hypothetical protein [bacterium]